MRRLAITLEATYGTPDLGNMADPLDEAIYILLTYQTNLARAQQVWAAIRVAFPSWQSVLDAREQALAKVLRPGGFQHSRARLIRRLLVAVARRWGALSLASLGEMSDARAEAELRALPGFDTKGARCVLMYSLGRNVFPVDSNVYRFMARYGVLARSSRYRRQRTHDALQEIVPPVARYALHVNLIVHGQTTCRPQMPDCASCLLRRTCKTGRNP